MCVCVYVRPSATQRRLRSSSSFPSLPCLARPPGRSQPGDLRPELLTATRPRPPPSPWPPPVSAPKPGSVLVTGTLGLSYPVTAAALRRAMAAAKGAGATVLIDVNWRPVFWEDTQVAGGRVVAGET